jgi:peptidoglycan/LPS O-acetylase OafA/YrhL
LLVFLSHAGLDNLIPGGFGVTIFFFLSGYLITTLLRVEHEDTGRINFKRFYLRRVYRIFPPMYIVLATLVLLGCAGVVKSDMTVAGVTAQLVNFTNYYIILHGPSHLVPLTIPLWSLAIEEHFYFLFPLTLTLLLRRLGYRGVAVTFAMICTAVLLWRCYLVMDLGFTMHYTYMATDTRLDSLLYGCVMGVWNNPSLDRDCLRINSRGWALLLFLSVVVLLVTFLFRSPVFRETFRYSLQGIALFPLFYCSVRFSSWPIFSWLELKLLRGFGVISYTFYLCHFACLRLAERYIEGSAITRGIGAFALAIAFACVTYFFVERHLGTIRRRLHG